jgi:ABC-type antimicrobial peptide transport system ATPase subunit
VKPILSFKPKLSIKDILLNPLIFREINPALMRERSFSEPFRKIALKPNWKKLNVLKTIVKLLSNGKKEIIVPAGNIERGLIFDSNLITIKETRADFYGK